ncbi:tetratricopeptide repeat protein, partial [Planctomycetota bacterium]
NFGLSLESKIASAVGAGMCFYNIGAYEDAEKWLVQYLDLAENSKSNDLYSAYFILGKTYLALENSTQAGNAFQRALTEQNSREQFVEAVTALVKGNIEQGNFVEALDALENIRSVALSQEQSVEMLLLRSEVNQKLGLVDTAITSLRDKAEYILDSQLNAKIAFELAKCLIIKEDLELAADYLTEVLRMAEPGPLTQDATLELANVCLELAQYSQTKSLCLKLLDMDLTIQTRQKTLKILAEVYNKEKDYDKAALTLSGQWK